jgi:integrative and conjugative element protein (TIGR02256 family)
MRALGAARGVVDDAPVRILLHETAAAAIRAESEGRAPKETGGLLAGFRLDGVWVITSASPPGPKARHRSSAFVRDGKATQLWLDARVAETRGRDDYLGEWHSHPFPMGPSCKDQSAMRAISRNPQYGTATPLMLLCRREAERWSVEVWQWTGTQLTRCEVEVVAAL